MSPALLLTLLALTAPDDPAPPGPKERISGLFGLTVTSRVETADAEADLKVWYGFPDRARQVLVPVGGRESSRALVMRYGEGFWSVAPFTLESEVLDDAERARTERLFELRRALFLWPRGFEWTGRTRRTADLGEIGGELVLLQADLGPDERPTAMRVLADDGRVLAAMTDVRWSEEPGNLNRHWPASLTLEEGGLEVWRETVQEVDKARMIEGFFVPLDRREGVVGTASERPQAIQLPPTRWRFTAVPEGTDVETCLRLADAAIEARLRSDPKAPLDRSPILALDPNSRPTGFWLSQPVEGPTPEGWTEAPARAALRVLLDHPGAFDDEEVRNLYKGARVGGWVRKGLLLRVRPKGEDPRLAEALLLVEKP